MVLFSHSRAACSATNCEKNPPSTSTPFRKMLHVRPVRLTTILLFILPCIAVTMPSGQSFRINNIQPSCPTIVCYFASVVFYYGQPLMAQQVRRTILALCCSVTLIGRPGVNIGHRHESCIWHDPCLQFIPALYRPEPIKPTPAHRVQPIAPLT